MVIKLLYKMSTDERILHVMGLHTKRRELLKQSKQRKGKRKARSPKKIVFDNPELTRIFEGIPELTNYLKGH